MEGRNCVATVRSLSNQRLHDDDDDNHGDDDNHDDTNFYFNYV